MLLEEDALDISLSGHQLHTGCRESFGKPDLCICVDCSDEGRLNKRVDAYRNGGSTLCIDHHLAPADFGERGFCDHYYIDSGEAACSQIIYGAAEGMG